MSISKAAQELGRKGGQAKSPAKTAAARANAKKPRHSAQEWKRQRNDLLKTAREAVSILNGVQTGWGVAKYILNEAIHRAESVDE